jgi:hypothetical protein
MTSETHTDLTKMYVSIEVLSQKLDEIIKMWKKQQTEIVDLQQRIPPLERLEREKQETNKTEINYSPPINCNIPWF